MTKPVRNYPVPNGYKKIEEFPAVWLPELSILVNKIYENRDELVNTLLEIRKKYYGD